MTPEGNRPGAHLLIALAAGLSVSPAAHAQPLAEGRAGASARVVASPPSRVRFAAGEFVMGTDLAGIELARSLCQRELSRLATPGGGVPAMSAAVVWSGCMQLPPNPTPCSVLWFANEAMTHTVWLPAFGMDRTEVSVAAYARCVDAGRCAPAFDPPGTPWVGAPAQPVTGLRWSDARDYCSWVGGRLPTEAEWERAARGRDGRPFPWGWIFDPGRANHGALWPDCRDTSDGFAHAAPVGSFTAGQSPEGVLDLAGNVSEWVADRADRLGAGWSPERRVAPLGPDDGGDRVVRGGSWATPGFTLRGTWRGRRSADTRSRDVGFRCAYD